MTTTTKFQTALRWIQWAFIVLILLWLALYLVRITLMRSAPMVVATSNEMGLEVMTVNESGGAWDRGINYYYVSGRGLGHASGRPFLTVLRAKEVTITFPGHDLISVVLRGKTKLLGFYSISPVLGTNREVRIRLVAE